MFWKRSFRIVEFGMDSTTIEGDFKPPFGEPFTSTVTLPLTFEQANEGLRKWTQENGYLQNCFPTLTDAEREWFLTGASVPDIYPDVPGDTRPASNLGSDAAGSIDDEFDRLSRRR